MCTHKCISRPLSWAEPRLEEAHSAHWCFPEVLFPQGHTTGMEFLWGRAAFLAVEIAVILHALRTVRFKWICSKRNLCVWNVIVTKVLMCWTICLNSISNFPDFSYNHKIRCLKHCSDDAKHPLLILMGQFLSLIPSWLKELLTFTSSRVGLFLSLQPINSSCFDKSYGIFALWGIFFYSRNRK